MSSVSSDFAVLVVIDGIAWSNVVSGGRVLMMSDDTVRVIYVGTGLVEGSDGMVLVMIDLSMLLVFNCLVVESNEALVVVVSDGPEIRIKSDDSFKGSDSIFPTE